MIPADLRVKQVPDCWAGTMPGRRPASSGAMRSQLLYTWLQVLGMDNFNDTVVVVMKHGNSNS